MGENGLAELRKHQLKQLNRFWYVAAKLALAGDPRALAERVALYEADRAPLVASEV